MENYNVSTYGDCMAPVYDEWSVSRSDAEAELADIIVGVSHPPGSVMEIGIGTGRIASLLQRLGYQVWGIDSSLEMLRRAQMRSEIAKGRLICGDAAEVVLRHKFHLIACVFNTFSMFDTEARQRAVMRNCAAMLRPGGALVLETSEPQPDRYQHGQRLSVISMEGRSLRLLAELWFPEEQVIEYQNVVVNESGVRFFPGRSRLVTPEQVGLLATQAGLVEDDSHSRRMTGPRTTVQILRRPM